jgi:carbamoylphosphate synthase large subunit
MDNSTSRTDTADREYQRLRDIGIAVIREVGWTDH